MCHFLESSRTPQLLTEASGHTENAVRGLSLMNGNANGPRLVSQCTCDALTDPPCCICAELKPFAVLITLGCFHQSDISLLYEIQQSQATTCIVFCDIHD